MALQTLQYALSSSFAFAYNDILPVVTLSFDTSKVFEDLACSAMISPTVSCFSHRHVHSQIR